MDLSIILNAVVSKVPAVGLILMGLGALVVLAQLYIAMSPSKNDDAWLQKLENIPIVGAILKALMTFAPIQRKDK